MDLADARERAIGLMEEYGLRSMGWRLVWDNAKRRAGQTRHWPKEISLSRNLVALNDWPVVETTVRHEIAHALVGPGHGHGAVWKAMALQVGAAPRRCYDSEVTTMPPPMWEATCQCPGLVFERWQRPSPRWRGRCRACGTVVVFERVASVGSGR